MALDCAVKPTCLFIPNRIFAERKSQPDMLMSFSNCRRCRLTKLPVLEIQHDDVAQGAPTVMAKVMLAQSHLPLCCLIIMKWECVPVRVATGTNVN